MFPLIDVLSPHLPLDPGLLRVDTKMIIEVICLPPDAGLLKEIKKNPCITYDVIYFDFFLLKMSLF